jgi:hypothetical protein
MTAPERPSAVAYCAQCPWSARHTADDVVEVATVLRTLLLTHIRDRHGDIGEPQPDDIVSS